MPYLRTPPIGTSDGGGGAAATHAPPLCSVAVVAGQARPQGPPRPPGPPPSGPEEALPLTVPLVAFADTVVGRLFRSCAPALPLSRGLGGAAAAARRRVREGGPPPRHPDPRATGMCCRGPVGVSGEGRAQTRLGRRLEEVAKAVGGGYCRLQMPLRLALAVRGTVAAHMLGALEGGGGGVAGRSPPPSGASLPHPQPKGGWRRLPKRLGAVCCRLQVPLRLALAVRGTMAGHRLGFWRGGGGGAVPPPPSNASLPQPWPSPEHEGCRRAGQGSGEPWSLPDRRRPCPGPAHPRPNGPGHRVYCRAPHEP